MENLLLWFIIFCFIGMCFFIYMLYRNRCVSEFRFEILKIISEKCTEDIINDKDWKWRYDMYETVSYNTILNKFWKKLKPENFYDDISFLK